MPRDRTGAPDSGGNPESAASVVPVRGLGQRAGEVAAQAGGGLGAGVGLVLPDQDAPAGRGVCGQGEQVAVAVLADQQQAVEGGVEIAEVDEGAEERSEERR